MLYDTIISVLDDVSQQLVSLHADLADMLAKESDIDRIFEILEARDYMYPAYDLITRMSNSRASSGEYVSVKELPKSRNKYPWHDMKVNDTFKSDKQMYNAVEQANRSYAPKQFKAVQRNKQNYVTRVK